MKIIFMGTPQFAVVCLKKLRDSGLHISAVVTTPDRPVGRGLKLLPSPVKIEALDSDIPVLQPENLKEPVFLSRIDEIKPDLMIIVAFRILPEILFLKARHGAVNLHGSLLPKYRGAAPINWAIINGEAQTGLTTFFLKQRVDTGNIICQEKIEISPDMTAGELHDIMAEKGAELLLQTIKLIEGDNVKISTQEETEVTRAPKIFPQDCLINFNQHVKKVHDFIRGLSPNPGAYTYYKNKRIQLFKSTLSDIKARENEPGSFVESGNYKALLIQCNPGTLKIVEIKMEGKRQMPVEDFLRGHTLTPNSIFGSTSG